MDRAPTREEFDDLRERFDYLVDVLDMLTGNGDGHLAERIDKWARAVADQKAEMRHVRHVPRDAVELIARRNRLRH